MPTVIDSFVLELGLDPSKFTRGQREAMDSLRKFQESALTAGNAVESQNKRVFDLLSSFRREIVTTLGLFLGGRGAGEFIKFITTLDAATGRFSRTVGMGARDVSAWGSAFREIGGTTESAMAALGGLSSEMNRFQLTGQSAMLPVLSRLGISLYDQNRNLKTSGQLWLELADAVQGMDPRQAAEFLRMIPGANQDMINFALLGRRAMEIALAANRARAPSPEDIERAKQFQKSMADIDTSATNVGRSLTNFVAPALTTVLNKLTELFDMWGKSTKGPGGQKVISDTRAEMNRRFGTPRRLMEIVMGPKTAEEIYGLAGGAGGAGGSSGGANWANFLSGLSYLETSQQNTSGSPGHSASGFFQFQPATAARAQGAGIADPRAGGYGDQAAATMQYIRKFHPDAAAAIDRGDFGPAIAALRGEWPSLPGGSQSQSAARYQTFAEELRGGGPRPPGGGGITIGSIIVNAPNAKDADGIAREIAPALKRSLSAGAANYGQQ